MDKNGFSDPYARFLMNGEILCKSDTKKKCLNPVWNQTFAVKIPASRGKLVVEVYDHDVIGSNDLIGCSEIDLGPLIPDLKLGVLLYIYVPCANHHKLGMKYILSA